MYWVFATLHTFFTIIIAQLLIEPKLRIIYYLAMILLFISLNNVYYSIKYYIDLRNHKGVKGDDGDPGDPGQEGSNGVCVMSKTCGIVNCRKLITETLEKKFTDFKLINDKVNDNLELSDGDKEKKHFMEKYINILLPQCENYDLKNGSIKEFETHIDTTIKNIKEEN